MTICGQIELVRLLMAQLSIVRAFANDDRALLPLQHDT